VDRDYPDHRAVPRKERILTGLGYRLEGEGSPANPRIEFVTEAFPETYVGRIRLQKALTDIQAICTGLDSPEQKLIPVTSLKSYYHWLTRIDKPAARIKTSHGFKVKPQMTAGLRLDRLGALIEGLHQGPVEGLRASERAQGKFMLAGNGIPEAPDASAGSRAAMARYTERTGQAPSQQLKSLITMVALYVKKAQQFANRPKYIAPLMFRTDFATALNLLPERKTSFAMAADSGRNLWTEICLLASGVDGGNSLLPNIQRWTDKGILADPNHLKVQPWLEGIYAGWDLLTKQHYPVAEAKNDFESMGGLGQKTDVGPGNMPLPIVEFRQMKDMDMTRAAAMAMDAFDYIWMYNHADQAPGLDYLHGRQLTASLAT
jgi:hypothetical protein